MFQLADAVSGAVIHTSSERATGKADRFTAYIMTKCARMVSLVRMPLLLCFPITGSSRHAKMPNKAPEPTSGAGQRFRTARVRPIMPFHPNGTACAEPLVAHL